MNRRNVLVAAGVAVLLAGCGGGGVSWNQKLTLVVETPHGEVTGYGITSIRFAFKEDAIFFAPGYGSNSDQNGEAAFVEVAPGKFLFALIEEKNKFLAVEALIPADKRDPYKAATEAVAASRIKVELSRSLYPMLVTFGDVNVPASVKEVKPGDLEAVFGAGYHLKSINLEITDEAVNEVKIETILNWIGRYRGKYLDGGITTNPQNSNLSNHVGDGGFRIER